MRITTRLLTILGVITLMLSTGCFEVADLVKSIGNDDTPENPTDTGNQSSGDSDGEVQYGPFPDDADTNGDSDSDDDGGADDGDSDDGIDDGEPTLEALPDGAEVETLESGLGVYDFEVGTGDQPESRSVSVRVNYAGYIQDTGRQFDAGDGVVFGLSNVIDGFAEGILGMKVGGRRRIIIPPDLGYGAGGNAGAGIGGEDVIVFDVDLLAIE